MKKNVLANYIGTIWVALLMFGAIPFYVARLGPAEYGLVGFFMMLQTLFLVLDFGLSVSLNRELAFLAAKHGKEIEMRTLARSSEIFYWGVAIFLGSMLIIFSPIICRYWLNLKDIPINVGIKAVALMGVITIFRWPVALYIGGLMGMQRQVTANITKIIIETIRVGGALTVVFIRPSIIAFFVWQCVISIFAIIGFFTVFWSIMPKINKQLRKFDFNSLRKIGSYTLGISGITITAIILTQLDKVVLSKVLSLNEFGYYSVISTLALALTQTAIPLSNAVFPRLSHLISLQDEDSIKHLYHKSCQAISVICIPAALIIIFFSKDILFLWTQNMELAVWGQKVLKILVLGTMLNLITLMPLTLQLAYKWTKLFFLTSVTAIIIFCPLMVVTAKLWGPMGPALMWVGINILFLCVMVPLMHRRYLKTEFLVWLKKDVLPPIIGSLPIILLIRYVISPGSSGFQAIPALILAVFCSFSAAILSTPLIRELVFGIYHKFKK